MPDVPSHKQCSKCKEIKPISDFSQTHSQCNKCRSAWQRSYNQSEKGQKAIQQYHASGRASAKVRKYLASEKGKAARGRYLSSDRVKEMRKLWQRNYSKLPEVRQRIKAMNALNHAVERGQILKANRCLKCGTTGKIDGHHHRGYSPEFWLDVQWLCRKCHGVFKRKFDV